MRQRLHKILAASTELSRRAAEKAITSGEVTVDGAVVTKLGSLADPNVNKIKWNGRLINPPREKIYIIYNKPKNKLVTKRDPEGRKTIWEDLKKFQDQVNAVGRLDYDSEGLLILTNDGELINRLTHPRHEIKKIYNIKVKGHPHSEDLNKLRKGLKYKSATYQPAEIRVKKETETSTWIDIRIREGKNRQVRNMFFAIGHPVQKLKRTMLGPIKLGKLESAEWRFLRRNEKEALLQEAGLMPKSRRRYGRGRPHGEKNRKIIHRRRH